MHRRVGFDRYLMIALLVASVLHAGWCAPEGEPPADEQPQSSSSSSSSPSVSAFVSATINEAGKLGSEVKTATEESFKAAGRFSMAAFRLAMKLVSGVSQTAAATGTVISSGVKQVNKITGPVPVLGTVTTGMENLVTGTTETFKVNSDFNKNRRDQMLDQLLERLDNFTPGKPGGAAAGTEAAGAEAAA